MAKGKRKIKCFLCGENIRQSTRYYPKILEGKFKYVCAQCADEAKYGKFGNENKKYYKERVDARRGE